MEEAEAEAASRASETLGAALLMRPLGMLLARLRGPDSNGTTVQGPRGSPNWPYGREASGQKYIKEET